MYQISQRKNISSVHTKTVHISNFNFNYFSQFDENWFENHEWCCWLFNSLSVGGVIAGKHDKLEWRWFT